MLHDRSGSVKENGPSQRATSAYRDNLRRLASHASTSVGPRDVAAVRGRSETGRIGGTPLPGPSQQLNRSRSVAGGAEAIVDAHHKAIDVLLDVDRKRRSADDRR